MILFSYNVFVRNLMNTLFFKICLFILLYNIWLQILRWLFNTDLRKWILITTYSCLSHWLHYPLDCGGLLIDLEVVLALE